MTDWATIVGDDFAAPGGPDDRVDGVVPRWVVRPGSVAEVQAAVRSGDALVASGLGAHLEAPRRGASRCWCVWIGSIASSIIRPRT